METVVLEQPIRLLRLCYLHSVSVTKLPPNRFSLFFPYLLERHIFLLHKETGDEENARIQAKQTDS
jgi:hypothetical protein